MQTVRYLGSQVTNHKRGRGRGFQTVVNLLAVVYKLECYRSAY